MNKIKLVVYNEYALGYMVPEIPVKVFTLADSVIKGAPFRAFSEPYYIGANDKVRLATSKDFDDFNVCFEGYNDLEMYEFNETESVQSK